MNKILFLKLLLALPVLILIFVHIAVGQSTSSSEDEEWISIFNGKNLNGWIPKVTGYRSGENPLNGFRVENGILKVDYSNFAAFNGRFGHLFYKEKLSSFMLHIEYRFVGELLPDAPSYCVRNSGVMIYSQSPESMGVTENWPVSIEVQLLGSTERLKQTTGNICTPGTTISFKGTPTHEHGISANSKYYNNNEWVNLDVIVHSGEEIINIINGDTVLITSQPRVGGFLLPERYLVADGTLLTDGYIALQAEGQPIDFRNIKLKVLNEKESLSKDAKEKLQPISQIKIIDNFESYYNNKQLEDVWHKSQITGQNKMGLDSKIKCEGKYSLKCEYTTKKKTNQLCSIFYRNVKWDTSNCNGIEFWFKPDGSGDEIIFQVKTSDKTDHNSHDLWSFTYLTEKGDTMARYVTVPFFSFKHNAKNHKPIFKPETIINFSISIKAGNNEPHRGVLYFDDFAWAKLQF